MKDLEHFIITKKVPQLQAKSSFGAKLVILSFAALGSKDKIIAEEIMMLSCSAY